jgi:hypothetical protein
VIKHLVIVSALAMSSIAIAHADPISGYFSANGTDSFTSSTITFGNAAVAGSTGGTFASYLSDGDTVNFLSGSLPYHIGTNVPPSGVYPSGMVPIFSVTGDGETFTFEMTQYNAGYVERNPTATSGCNLNSTCLDVTGEGFFKGTGAFSGESGPGTFTFSSQYVDGQPDQSITTFSASTSAVAPSAVPEPTSLALFGTGVFGVLGIARRRINAQHSRT